MASPSVALTAVVHACTDAIATIANTDHDHDHDRDVPLHLVLKDVDALFVLVYNTATKLALALKPPTPSYHASISILADLETHPPALALCTRLLRDDAHGATLTKHLRSITTEVVDALRALVQTFLNNAARGPKLVETSPASEEYLVRTAALHDLITNARNPPGIPKDNQAAVYRAWKADRDSLEDNLEELANMIKDAQSDDTADQSDNGWDDIGLGHTTSMDQHELARANNVRHLLRLTTLFHRRIFLDILPHPSSAPPSTFDALLAQSNLLLSTSDDLVAAFYSPHDSAYVCAQIIELANIATSLHSQLVPLFPITDELTSQLCTLNIDNPNPAPSKKKADKKWFDTCLDQIRRSCSTATE